MSGGHRAYGDQLKPDKADKPAERSPGGASTALPLCSCHGQPSRWNKDARYRAGGFWRCRVRDGREKPEAHKAASRRWYHKPEGGYVRRRRRELARQRVVILDRLAQLRRP